MFKPYLQPDFLIGAPKIVLVQSSYISGPHLYLLWMEANLHAAWAEYTFQ